MPIFQHSAKRTINKYLNIRVQLREKDTGLILQWKRKGLGFNDKTEPRKVKTVNRAHVLQWSEHLFHRLTRYRDAWKFSSLRPVFATSTSVGLPYQRKTFIYINQIVSLKKDHSVNRFPRVVRLYWSANYCKRELSVAYFHKKQESRRSSRGKEFASQCYSLECAYASMCNL